MNDLQLPQKLYDEVDDSDKMCVLSPTKEAERLTRPSMVYTILVQCTVTRVVNGWMNG